MLVPRAALRKAIERSVCTGMPSPSNIGQKCESANIPGGRLATLHGVRDGVGGGVGIKYGDMANTTEDVRRSQQGRINASVQPEALVDRLGV